MRAYTKHISLLLLAVISAFIVPKELVHAFYGHTDTVHVAGHAHNDITTIEQQHRHCEILNFNAPLYFLSLSFFSAAAIIYGAAPIQKVETIFPAPHTGLLLLRGPPCC